MFRNIFNLLGFCAICFMSFYMISCGVSTGEVVDAGGVMENKEDDFYGENENSVKDYFTSDDGIKVVYVNSGEIPIIEICPPPFEVPVTEENIIEKVPGKPGDSYDNLLPPVEESECDTGMVCVFTDVPDVEVSFNNRVVGVSNIGVVGIIPRIYILGLSKDGYEDESLWISVGENKKQSFFVEMEKLEE